MKIGIMQPYFFPFISYFQLISAVDIFYFHDDCKYTKKGFINRNVIKLNGEPHKITLPLVNSPDFELIQNKIIAPTFNVESILKTIQITYGRSEYFEESFTFISSIFRRKQENLSKYLADSIIELSSFLDIKTKFSFTSEHNVKSLNRVNKITSICRINEATQYLNPINGMDLYKKNDFNKLNIGLNFINCTYTDPEDERKYSIIHTLFTRGVKETKYHIRNSMEII
jgi:hypothetical protein